MLSKEARGTWINKHYKQRSDCFRLHFIVQEPALHRKEIDVRRANNVQLWGLI
jgi:hypothetical protein